MWAGDLSKLEISKTFYAHYTRVASFDLGEKQTQETIFFEVRSSPCSHQPVTENCLFQHAVKQPVKLTSKTFFVPTLYKKTSIFCRWNKLTRSFVLHLHSLHERFLVLPCSLRQSTCGKSNQSVNSQTHAGLEGILSNYFSVPEEGFPVWTTLLLFALSTLCQSPSVNFDMSNLRPTVTHI